MWCSKNNCLRPVIYIAYIGFLYEFIDVCDPSFGTFADDHQIHLSSALSNNEIQNNKNTIESASKKNGNFLLLMTY